MNTVLYFDIVNALLFLLLGIGICLFLRVKQKKSLMYLLFFTVFYLYLYKVLDYTLFQFQSLLLLKLFLPKLMLHGQAAGKEIHFIPLITLTAADIKTSLLNILLMVPLGFGLPFITSLRMKHVVLFGALFSIGIEFVQWITGLLAKITFRIADSNDVLFNTAGVAIGYILFIGFVRIVRHVSHNRKISINPILQFIINRPQT